jgi:zinc/manganese transport system substrate-binding protein
MSLRNHLSRTLVSALPFGLLLAAGCGASSSGGGQLSQATEPVYAADAGAITVTGAENFYADLLHQVGGSKLKIYSFLSDPSADPHQYESNSSNAKAVADSRLVIENGLGYDSFMQKLLKASPKQERVVINVQNLIGAKDGANPHVWYGPTVMPGLPRLPRRRWPGSTRPTPQTTQPISGRLSPRSNRSTTRSPRSSSVTPGRP